MKYVVDTNVPIVANGGKDVNASPLCRLKAIDFLEAMMAKGCLILDSAGEVEAEYGKHLKFGQPGVGNRFIQAFFTTAIKRIHRIDIDKDKNGEYEDFPKSKKLSKFDKSDRKFVALGIKAGEEIANATDTDWLNDLEALEESGVKVHFLCTKDTGCWFDKG